MKGLVALAAIAAATAAFVPFGTLRVVAGELPEWAYPVAPPPVVPDNVMRKTLPGSAKSYTQAEIDNRFSPPDWYPDDHPPMPEPVAHGKKPNAFACDLCHLTSGGGHPESAGVSGLPMGYILRQMAEFKAGVRHGMRAPVMIQIAQALDDEEIKAAAGYFASMKFPAWYKVVESDTVPKSYIGKGTMRFAVADGGDEPIGHRIIELPQNDESAESRDPRTGFVAHVPVGSIKRGEAIARGATGVTACAVCHGPALTGLGDIPGIVGRSPMYIYRQLNDIKIGTRSGAMVPLMKPVVDRLSEDDMLALAAFLVSRGP